MFSRFFLFFFFLGMFHTKLGQYEAWTHNPENKNWAETKSQTLNHSSVSPQYPNVPEFLSPDVAPELQTLLSNLTPPFKRLIVFSNLIYPNLNSWSSLQNLLYPVFSSYLGGQWILLAAHTKTLAIASSLCPTVISNLSKNPVGSIFKTHIELTLESLYFIVTIMLQASVRSYLHHWSCPRSLPTCVLLSLKSSLKTAARNTLT